MEEIIANETPCLGCLPSALILALMSKKMEAQPDFLLNIASATAHGMGVMINDLKDDDYISLNLSKTELEQCIVTLKKFVSEVNKVVTE